jgi:DNA (cytosine-5)-methyltransferase 1
MNVDTSGTVGTLRSETHGHEPIIFEPRSADGVPRISKDISPTLNTMGGGQREPCVAHTFAIQGNIIDRSDTAGANGKGVKEEQAFTLNTIDRQAVATIAFNERQQAMTCTDECGNTLSATDYKGVQAVAYSFDSLASNSMKSSNPKSGCRIVDTAKTIDTTTQDPSKNQGGIAVAHTFKIRSGCEGGGKGYLGQDEAAFTLDTTQSQNLMHQTAIRRLTPVECERLQGFPDNYTQIPYRNKPPHACPDGPRYKALGNSMAVPVLKWIGERINEINKLL